MNRPMTNDDFGPLVRLLILKIVKHERGKFTLEPDIMINREREHDEFYEVLENQHIDEELKKSKSIKEPISIDTRTLKASKRYAGSGTVKEIHKKIEKFGLVSVSKKVINAIFRFKSNLIII